MKWPLIYDLATQWHSNRFRLMACYYHLPYRANNSSWEKPHLSPGKALPDGICGTPGPTPWWQGDPQPRSVAGGSRGEAGHPSCQPLWESSSQPLLMGPGNHQLSGGRDITATNSDAVPPCGIFSSESSFGKAKRKVRLGRPHPPRDKGTRGTSIQVVGNLVPPSTPSLCTADSPRGSSPAHE